MSSRYFKVKSFRNNKVAEAIFIKGNLENYLEHDLKSSEKEVESDGTLVMFQPDKEVFINMTEGFTFERVCNEIRNIAYLNKGIHFLIETTSGKKQEYYSENGIADFIADTVKKPLMKKPIICGATDGTDEVEIAFIWTGGQDESYVFVNGLLCPEGGTPITAAKRTFTSKIKSLTKKDFAPELIRKGLVYAINCKVFEPSFANQTKSKILNNSVATLTNAALKKGLDEFASIPEFNTIIELMEKFQKAEKAADKAREAILNHTKEMETLKKQKIAFINKLKDSKELGENSILLCVEGDSAASMVAKARDTKNFGLLALRGKCINCLSNPEEKYLANEEIKLILYAMGIDIHHYDSKKLRYGKIGICVDADDDGMHIALLIMAALQALCPQFIKENRLCWLRAPLFVEQRKNKRYYYFTDEEKQKADITGELIRLKGLGSMSPQEMEESMFTKQQHLDILEYSKEAEILLEQLMGPDVLPRKEFIFNNIDFSNYGEM